MAIWLTLCPAVTSWVGRNPNRFWPDFFYVVVYMMWSFSYGVLSKRVVKANDSNSHVAIVLSRDRRSQISMIINLIILVGVFFYPPLGMIGRFFVSAIWIVSYRTANKYFQKVRGLFFKS